MSVSRLVVVSEDQFVTWEMKQMGRSAKASGISLSVMSDRHAAFQWTGSVDPGDRAVFGPADNATTRGTIVLGRMGVSHFPGLFPTMSMLEAAGLKVVNGCMTHQKGRHKAVMAACFAAAAVPHPETWYVSRKNVYRICHQLPYPLLLKPVSGSGGLGIQLIDSPDRLRKIAATHMEPLLLQRFIGHQRAQYRAFVIGDQVIGTVLKKSDPKEWRSNRHFGVKFEPINTSTTLSSIALRAARAVGADIAAVDIIHGRDGLFVLEVNVCPSFELFTRATAIDVANEIIRFLQAILSSWGSERTNVGG